MRSDNYAGGYQGHDQLDPADSLTGDIGSDPMDAGYSPPDREPVATRWGNTLDEQRRGESLEQHLAEEEPEVCDADLDHVEEDPRAGRLVSADRSARDAGAGQEICDDVGPDGWAASAEEAAVHVYEV
jgi:hypothetical protein